MTTQQIIESGMTFGPFLEDRFFYIEHSDCYKAIQEYVKMAEFLLLRENNERPMIWIVEAKSSTPKPETEPNFTQFISEIREKFINAFSLGWASFLRRHLSARGELPEAFKTLDLSKTGVIFVLVIKGHHKAWLPPINDALAKSLRSTVKCWALAPTSVVVMNDSMAQQYGLIIISNEVDDI